MIGPDAIRTLIPQEPLVFLLDFRGLGTALLVFDERHAQFR
jgi:hypothetical protein